MSGKGRAPPLPPRASSSSGPSQTEALPAYTELDTGPYASLAPDDPRSSSTQSLLPEDTPQHDDRRTLLLVYIHGFMGAETSFQSFPLHVHNYLTLLLADSHVIHTKIYPRYKSKRQIQFARDDFSKWLSPHECPTTDVVLLGHSMGGLLSAEVALMPAPRPTSGGVFKHRILGTLNFDVPFLGMHPGVVSAGLASIFRSKSPERKQEATDGSSGLASPSMATLSSTDGASLSQVTTTASISSEPPKWINSLLAQTDTADPNFNPKFNNDVNLPVRKGWNKALHFISKHSDNLIKSSQDLVKSHMEFGGAMADYSGLKARYKRLRMLEDDAENERRSVINGTSQHVPRVRFVNFYTASTGRPKKPPVNPAMTDGDGRGRLGGPSSQTLDPSETRERSRSQSPRISLEEVKGGGEVLHKQAEVPETPTSHEEEDETLSESSLELTEPFDESNGIWELSSLPEIPPMPPVPDSVDLMRFRDPDVRRAVERRHKRAMRAYKQALRDRDAAVKDRAKLEAKYSGKSANDGGERAATATPSIPDDDIAAHTQSVSIARPPVSSDEDVLARYRSAEAAAFSACHDRAAAAHTSAAPDAQSMRAPSEAGRVSLATVTSAAGSEREHEPEENQKKKKDRKFCMLPGKNAQGERDPTWVRIFMRDIDEVTAHCGLFVQESDTYEMFVGEVGQKIEEWVRDDLSRRAVEAHG